MSTLTERRQPRPKSRTKRVRRERRATALSAHGEPMVWLTGGALALSVCMIVGLLVVVVFHGGSTFWPGPVVRVERDARAAFLGEIHAEEIYQPAASAFAELAAEDVEDARRIVARNEGASTRRMLRTGNYEITGRHFDWVSDFEISGESRPEWAIVVEREEWGRFYGTVVGFVLDGAVVSTEPAAAWRAFEEHHDAARAAVEREAEIRSGAVADANDELEDARLALRSAELGPGQDSAEYAAREADLRRVEADTAERMHAVQRELAELHEAGARARLQLATSDGSTVELPLRAIVRAYPANQLGWTGALGVYVSRWVEFLTDEPRESNSEGGVFPAIFGTVVMTLLMSLLVVPFGVLAALYLREYAKPGLLVSTVRVAVNNLAGVPSIVFGVFGLGFFCYIVGATIDEVLFRETLPNPTFGKGGLMWASFTLALLTLPVVIVATEEALAAVPGSMREGSYACGATKWQTIQRIVLPRALPGIMTGMILAIARGAGEVAPLMLVGAVKLAHDLALDTQAPFLHAQRSFMHLGFHVYDLGFQSQNSEAAKSLVYTTTLVLIAIIVVLNVAAIQVRSRLRRRFAAGQM
ncbi:MAG: phosphate ABC transporter permease PstA [Planctomycetota bacterium]